MNEKSWKRERTRDWDRRNHYIPVTSCCSHVCSSTTAYTPLVQSRERHTLTTVIQTPSVHCACTQALRKHGYLPLGICPHMTHTHMTTIPTYSMLHTSSYFPVANSCYWLGLALCKIIAPSAFTVV